MEVCLYHDDKLQFDIVYKDILRAKILPRTCAHRLGMAVCSCRRNKCEIGRFLSAEKLGTVTSYINEHLLNRTDLPTNLKSFIEKILFRNVSLNDYSYCKFLSIVYDSLADKKYDQLTREATNSKPMVVVASEGAKANSKRKMNKKQFDLMAKRKLSNKERTMRVSLPMFAGNVMKLKKNAQYEAMRNSYGNSVFVQFCDKENTEHISNNKNITEVDIYAKEKTNAETFIKEARAHAHAIQEAEEKKRKEEIRENEKISLLRRAVNIKRHKKKGPLQLLLEQTLSMQRQQRRKMVRYRFDDNVRDPGMEEMALEYKESLEKEHCIKSSKKSHDNLWKKSTPSPLDGGHCLQCLAPFHSLKATDKENNQCKHHPGFIQYKMTKGRRETRTPGTYAYIALTTDPESNFVWTCCDQEAADGQPTHSSHKDTGCTVSIHCWRQNKKQLHKVSDKTDQKSRTRTLVKHGQSNSARDVISMYNAQFEVY